MCNPTATSANTFTSATRATEDTGGQRMETSDASAAPVSRRGINGRLIVVGLLALALFAAWRLGVLDYLNFETLRAQRQELTGFVSDNLVLAFAAFIAVYVVVTALALPGASWVTILGGYLFGLPGAAVATTRDSAPTSGKNTTANAEPPTAPTPESVILDQCVQVARDIDPEYRA